MLKVETVFSKQPEWGEVQEVLKTFHQKGEEAVLAGGCVRDALLGIPPKDFDVAVSAHPKEVLKYFPRAKDRWKRFGVVFLPLKEKGQVLEITTFRRESSYEDGRRPGVVEYTSSPKEDALRRDFTVNALFYDIKDKKILDFAEGLKDLKSRRLKTVGAPEKRFGEDYLRPLRALRFAHQLKFTIAPETGKAIPLFADKLQNLSKERIYSELLKMFSAGRMDQAVQILKEYSFFDVLFPFQEKPLKGEEFFHRTPFSFKEPSFIWAVLGLPHFYNSPKGLKDFLLSLKAPLATAKESAGYVQGVKTLFSKASFPEKLKVFSLGKDRMRELAQSFARSAGLPEKPVDKLFQEFQIRSGGGEKLPLPLVTGKDLLSAGYAPGRKTGELLKRAYDFQLEQNITEKKEILNTLFRLPPFSVPKKP